MPLLVELGHDVVVLVRSKERLNLPERLKDRVQVVVGDLLDLKSLKNLPRDLEIAYYLIHSMGHGGGRFAKLDEIAATNLISALKESSTRQIIYLSGLSSDIALSPHLASRRHVEKLLREGEIPVTVLRAGIIIGSGSASFEIIRGLIEKLPVMVAPKWVNTATQPIAIYDVLNYLIGVMANEAALGETFDIGGPDILTYKELLLRFAAIRGLKRWIITVPVLTPHLSSYWLYFVAATNYHIARTLVESLRNTVVCSENRIDAIVPNHCLTFDEAVRRAFSQIEEHAVISSWRDAWVRGGLDPSLSYYVTLPEHGCLLAQRIVEVTLPANEAVRRVFSIGGRSGWYYMNSAWFVRGAIDKLVGGVGIRRGRRDPIDLEPGDALDFWRVLLADRAERRLLLYAEMKLPGEAWLEFKFVNKGERSYLYQTATFRPQGVWGRLYWYLLFPIHYFIFSGMARAIAQKDHLN